MSGMILLGLALLLAGCLAAVWIFLREPRARALESRLDALSEHDVETTEEASIRIAPQRRFGTGVLIEKLLYLRMGVKEVNPVPWPFVLLGGALIGVFADFALRLITSGNIALPASVFVALFASRTFYQMEADRFSRALFEQLPDVIELLVSSVSAGLPVGGALRHVASSAPSPTREQFAKVWAEIEIGRPVDAALVQIFERSHVVEYAILAMTVGLQAQSGGRISESFENLSRIIRERVSVQKRAFARASEARLSGWVLSLLPIIFAFIISVVHPGYLRPFMVDPAARRLLGLAVILLLFGIFTMRGMIRWSTSE